MTKRIQIVARIEPDLRKAIARTVKRHETALRAYLDGLAPESASTINKKEPR